MTWEIPRPFTLRADAGVLAPASIPVGGLPHRPLYCGHLLDVATPILARTVVSIQLATTPILGVTAGGWLTYVLKLGVARLSIE